MNKVTPLFGIGLSLIFMMIGIYVATDVSRYNPEGSLSWQNYAGWGCTLFFGCILVAGIWQLVKGRPKL